MIRSTTVHLIVASITTGATIDVARAAVNCTPDTISLQTQADVGNSQTDHGPGDLAEESGTSS